MKFLWLSHRRLRLYVLDTPLLALVLFISFVVCLLNFLILYAMWMPHLRLNAEEDAAFRTFIIALQEGSGDIDTLVDLSDRLPMQSLRVEGTYQAPIRVNL